MSSIVVGVAKARIRVVCDEGHDRRLVRELGGRRSLFGLLDWQTSVFFIPFASPQELADRFARLRDAGFVFSADPARFPPAEIFSRLREKGLLAGPFRETLQRDGGERVVRER